MSEDGKQAMQSDVLVIDEQQVLHALPDLDVQRALRRMFRALADGQAVQPPQLLSLFPDQSGDFISYLGILAQQRVFGIKLSPYLPNATGAKVTAWTLLMSMDNGQPLMLCDAYRLTAERTAGTTALAIDLLAPADARRLTLVGTGGIGQAHLRHVLPMRAWQDVRLYSPDLAGQPSSIRQGLQAIDPRVSLHGNLASAVADADVIMLCTSSGTPVLQPDTLTRPALITSISTNVPRAHEVPPAALPAMDVYCDYRATTPTSAGEMQIATEQHGWDAAQILGDLPELIAGRAPLPDYRRHVFFRSIGLGLEDVAVAHDLYRLVRARAA